MNALAQAINTQEARTANGMKTLTSSQDHLVDLFFAIGASRGKDLTEEFLRALDQDGMLAVRLLMWARDVRGGAGERDVVRTILRKVESTHPQLVLKVLPHLAEFGRWDDLLIFSTQAVKNTAYGLVRDALLAGNGLCAKWTPRKGAVAAELRAFMGLSPKAYRKMLVGLTNVVETKMCAGEWKDIEYSKLPSLASSRYSRAFSRHDAEGYTQFKEALKAGTTTINSGAVYPYDILKGGRYGGDREVMAAQWAALPDYLDGSSILPMCDVSGSMSSAVAGNNNLSCMDVCISLGLYLSERNKSAYKDMILTFSGDTKIQHLTGDLWSRYAQLESADWGMNTDLARAFDRILERAVEWRVPQNCLPQYLLILSDMEFDQCVEMDQCAIDTIDRKFREAGYVRPKVVFWNLRARGGNVPVKFNQAGVALVSGFSPAIMKSVLAAKAFNPRQIVLDTLADPRYSVIV